MADNFGLKIGIEGEKEFKKALSDIDQSFKVLGSEMKLAVSQFDKNDRSVKSLTSRNEVLNRQIDEQKTKVETLRKALENASDSFGETDKRTKAWQTQLNNAQAELNGMERELKSSKKAIDETGNATDNLGGKFDKLGSVAKTVGVAMAAAFAAVSAAAVSAGKALIQMSVDGASHADNVLTTSAQTGIATDKLQEYMYAAELVDVSVDTLTGSMAKQIRSMKSAQDGSASFTQAYSKLGIAVTNADGSMRDSDTVYWELIDALGNVKNETERDALAMTLLGKSAQDLNPLIKAGSERMNELGEEAKATGYILSDKVLAAYGEFDDQLQRLKTGSEAAKNALGTILLPVLTDLAGEGVDLLREFSKGVADANGDMSKISEVVSSVLAKAMDKVVEYLPDVMNLIASVVGSVGQAIIDNLPAITQTAGEIILSLLNGMIAALPQLTAGALQLVLALANGIIENLPQIVQAAIDMVITLADGLADALPELIPSVVEAILLVCSTLIDNLDKLLDASFEIIKALAQGLLNALPELIDALPELITSIVNFITENLPEIIEMGIELTVQLAAGLIKAIPQLLAALPQIIVAIVGGLGKAVGAVFEIGANIVKGIWDGIKSMSKWISDKVSAFFSGIVDGIKGVLGIHSPSTVFAGIGENMGLGIGVGFTGAMRKIEKDIRGAVPTDFSFDVTGMRRTVGDTAYGVNQKTTLLHTGSIRVEGVSSEGELVSVVDIIIDKLRQEARVG